jgi:nitrous oxide reductase accessory protein NosL
LIHRVSADQVKREYEVTLNNIMMIKQFAVDKRKILNNNNLFTLTLLFLFIIILSGDIHSGNAVHAHFVEPAEGDSCPVCGMPPGKHIKWIAVIMFNDGRHIKFHGPKNMFIYYFNMAKYEQKYKQKDIASMHVTDYYTLKHFSAQDSYFVVGSTKKGPMGYEPVPFSDSFSAEAFRDEFGGKVIMFNDITPGIIDSMKNIITDDTP